MNITPNFCGEGQQTLTFPSDECLPVIRHAGLTVATSKCVIFAKNVLGVRWYRPTVSVILTSADIVHRAQQIEILLQNCVIRFLSSTDECHTLLGTTWVAISCGQGSQSFQLPTCMPAIPLYVVVNLSRVQK